MTQIPVIDLFAGPGGLSEGFSSFTTASGMNAFRVSLSVESDLFAWRTLRLRSFLRQFDRAEVPSEYFEYLRGETDLAQLQDRHVKQFDAAEREAWHATLGKEDPVGVRSRIDEATDGHRNWVLLGGPPCQAYSLVGRSRMRRVRGEEFDKDHRHFLYKEYLRILADHAPAAFVFENVKGLLSSKVNGSSVFQNIIRDLRSPATGVSGSPAPRFNPDYSLIALSSGEIVSDEDLHSSEVIVKSERYGIPQARHRVIILGVRRDLLHRMPDFEFSKLDPAGPTPVEDVIQDLPRLRSGLSRTKDSSKAWMRVLEGMKSSTRIEHVQSMSLLDHYIDQILEEMEVEELDKGAKFITALSVPKYKPEWFGDERLQGVINHQSRSHMPDDLHRYLFASCYGQIHRRSPQLRDFPSELLPHHRNVALAIEKGHFGDRFRVQRFGRPSTTITSHISKDGHYFIHYDPSQCRSLTVREAARIQTFPDNYYFEGNRTQQFVQVGNAVPPLLAVQIASVVYDFLSAVESGDVDRGDTSVPEFLPVAQKSTNGHSEHTGVKGRQTVAARSSNE